jgi:hypothetical protein
MYFTLTARRNLETSRSFKKPKEKSPGCEMKPPAGGDNQNGSRKSHGLKEKQLSKPT